MAQEMKLFSLMILLSFACTVPQSRQDDYPEPKSKEDCMQLFADILDVQKEREIGFIQMEIDVKALEAGKMSVRKFRKRRVAWQKKENMLRHKVTSMYDVGYKHGCFDEEEKEK